MLEKIQSLKDFKQKKELFERTALNLKYQLLDYTRPVNAAFMYTPEVKYIVSGWKPASTRA